MTAREYLSQVYRTEQQVNALTEEVAHLRGLAEKVTAAYGAIPGGHNPTGREDAISKCIMLEVKINDEMGKLIAMRQNVLTAILQLKNVDLRLILEMRYLHYKRWEQIAEELNYGIDNIYHLHRKALDIIAQFLPLD